MSFQHLPDFALDAIYHAASTHARMMSLLERGGPVSLHLELDIRDTYDKLQTIIIGQEYIRNRSHADKAGEQP